MAEESGESSFPDAEEPVEAGAGDAVEDAGANDLASALEDSILEGGELDSILDSFDRLKRERDEFLETAQRLQADFDNYKKRVARQEAETGLRAVKTLVVKLLPALDTLNLALAHATGEQGAGEAASLSQVASVLNDLLAKEGLEVIEPMGKSFDPEEAEAVAHDAGDGAPVVTEVFRVGYRWRGQTIRPAMVKVTGS